MTRVIAGSHGGRRLAAPPGRLTRPTSDRVREGLFSTLDALTTVPGCRFADLYAGSGAAGLEAASRGAAAVLLVESDARAARVAAANVADLGLGAVCRLVRAPVGAAVAAGPGEPYDVVFADPPYALADDAVTDLLAGLVAHGWLADGAVVVLERGSRSPGPAWPATITADRRRHYGESVLWYGRRASAGQTTGGDGSAEERA
jgi:16S rRNA (guanine(966)-N(2))-methyltransferase RsmD